MIAVVDAGLGNVGSIANMLGKIGSTCIVTADAESIALAERVVLPGVGAFDRAVERLRTAGLLDALAHAVIVRGRPVLGICLGMQLLTRGSEEGRLPGLGWIDGHVVRLNAANGLIVPHMGWNTVRERPGSVLLRGLDQPARFYFVHSYQVMCVNDSDVAGWTQYGNDIVAAVERGNIFGTQFHPEKSHRYGLAVLRNFVQFAV